MIVAAIIPARGGSMGVPRKNIRPFCGRPLIAWSIDQAILSKAVHRVFVTTEDRDVAKVAESYTAEIIERSEDLAQDDTPLDPVIVHAAQQIRPMPDLIVTLQPTCPIRPTNLIDECVEALIRTCSDSLFTVYEGAHFAWAGHRNTVPSLRFMRPLSTGPRLNRQQIPDSERVWLENGTVFVTRTIELLRSKARICGSKLSYEMSRWESVDIDTAEDFRVAELLFDYHRRLAVGSEAAAANCHAY